MSIYLSLALVILVFFLSFFLTSFSISLSLLKNHRILDRLHGLGGLFFYWKLHRQLLGKDLTRLKNCLSLVRTFFHYSFVICLTLFVIHFFIESSSPYIQALHPLLFVIILASVGLILTDTLPLFFAKRWPDLMLNASSLPSSIACTCVIWLVLPLIKLMQWQQEEQEPRDKDPSIEVREKMMEILHDFESEPVVDWQNKALLHGIMKYQDRVVREIMVPRVEIFCLPSSTCINDAAALILREGYTRIPVYEESIDHILGVIMAKDLLKIYLQAQAQSNAHMAFDATIAPLVKPVLFSPESKRVSALLQDFRKRHLHLAIVVDEYGGTEGLVTIEDILEEIVGDIEDEYDLGEKPFTLLSDGSYLVDAHVSILDLNENLGISIPTHGDYDTLSGYIFSKVGSIPSQGLVIHQNEFDLEVIDCSERSVETVRVRIHPTST